MPKRTFAETIEGLQYNAWLAAGLEPPPRLTPEVIDALLDEADERVFRQEAEQTVTFSEQARKTRADRRAYVKANPPVSAFEDASVYLQLSLARMLTDELLTATGRRSTGRMVFATMPTGLATASMHYFSEFQRSALFIDRGAVRLASWVAYVLARLTRFVGATPELVAAQYDEPLFGIVPGELTEDHPIFEMATVMSELVITGTVERLMPWDLEHCPAERFRLFSVTNGFMMNFMFGHELGHLELDHLGPDGGPKFPEPGDDTRMRAWQEEFEADQYGFQHAVVMEAHVAQRPAIATDPMLVTHLGSVLDFFCWAFQAVEILISQTRLGTAMRLATETHPSATRRRSQLNIHALGLAEVQEMSRRPSWRERFRDRLLGRSFGSQRVAELRDAYRERIRLHARFWSHVIAVAQAMINDDLQHVGRISPVWDAYRSLPHATFECAGEWREEDRF